MVKSLIALAIFGLLGAAVVALPGFAPQVEAREPVALAKGDRLDIRPVAGICSQQVWPSFDTSCLRNSEPGVMIREIRLVTARRQVNPFGRHDMTIQHLRTDIQIDHVSSAAICEEIGDRLRITMTGEPDRLPQQMMMLVKQMTQNDCVSAVLSDTSETAVN